MGIRDTIMGCFKQAQEPKKPPPWSKTVTSYSMADALNAVQDLAHRDKHRRLLPSHERWHVYQEVGGLTQTFIDFFIDIHESDHAGFAEVMRFMGWEAHCDPEMDGAPLSHTAALTHLETTLKAAQPHADKWLKEQQDSFIRRRSDTGFGFYRRDVPVPKGFERLRVRYPSQVGTRGCQPFYEISTNDGGKRIAKFKLDCIECGIELYKCEVPKYTIESLQGDVVIPATFTADWYAAERQRFFVAWSRHGWNTSRSLHPVKPGYVRFKVADYKGFNSPYVIYDIPETEADFFASELERLRVHFGYCAPEYLWPYGTPARLAVGDAPKADLVLTCAPGEQPVWTTAKSGQIAWMQENGAIVWGDPKDCPLLVGRLTQYVSWGNLDAIAKVTLPEPTVFETWFANNGRPA